MNSPQPQDWQRRIQELKSQIDSVQQTMRERNSSTTQSLNEIEMDAPSFGIDGLQRSYQQFIAWFNGIPSSGKLLAIAGGGLLSLTLIKTVFQLITSLVTLSIFGIGLYLVYRFWILPKGDS
jgi:Flp pilus assembly protein TadB